MPAKAPLDENVRFLYSCIIRSDHHSIDFHQVGPDFNINVAAARMRWSRLRKTLAVRCNFKGDRNHPRYADMPEKRKRKYDGPSGGSEKKGKGKGKFKSEGEDDDEPMLKREIKMEDDGDVGGFGMEFDADGDDFGQFEVDGIQSDQGGLNFGNEVGANTGDVKPGMGVYGGPSSSSIEPEGGDDTSMAGLLDPRLFATEDPSISALDGLRSSSLGLVARPAEAPGYSGQATALPPQSHMPIPGAPPTLTAGLRRIASPIPESPHINRTEAEIHIAAADTRLITQSVTDARNELRQPTLVDLSLIASSEAVPDGAVFRTHIAPEPTGKDAGAGHIEQHAEMGSGIEGGKTQAGMQGEGYTNEISVGENETCRMDKEATVSTAKNPAAEINAGPNVTTEMAEGRRQEGCEQAMCPRRDTNDDTPEKNGGMKEGQTDTAPAPAAGAGAAVVGNNELVFKLSDPSCFSKTELEPVIDSPIVKQHTTPNQEPPLFSRDDRKDSSSNRAVGIATGRLLRSAYKKKAGKASAVQGQDKGGAAEEQQEDWLESDIEEENYEDEDSDEEWVDEDPAGGKNRDE